MAQALSGASARFLGAHGPQRLPFTVADFTGGMLLAQAILLPLFADTGERPICGDVALGWNDEHAGVEHLYIA